MAAERLMPQDYFATAFEILAEHGHERLTIAELCARLGVTKGSFYHHFDGMPVFVEALLDDWVESFRGMIAELAAIADPVVLANRSLELFPGLNHRAEAVLRTWAHSDPAVADAVARRDHDLVLMQRHGAALYETDPERVDRLAELVLCATIGIQMRGRYDREHLLRLGQELIRCLLGVASELAEEDGQLHLRVADIGASPVR